MTSATPRDRGLTRVTLVEDHALFAEALDVALTLESHEVHRVAIDGPALSHEQLLSSILGSRPHVVLLDLNLGPSAHGVRLIRPLSQMGIPVIVVTGSTDPANWGRCLFNGARVVLPKSASLETIRTTISRVREGHGVLSHQERDRLLACFHEHRVKEQDGRARLATLTVREREILAELMNGRQVRQIAQDFVVSESTVRTQVKSILAKLGVSSQLAAVGVALRSHGRQPEHRRQQS